MFYDLPVHLVQYILFDVVDIYFNDYLLVNKRSASDLDRTDCIFV